MPSSWLVRPDDPINSTISPVKCCGSCSVMCSLSSRYPSLLVRGLSLTLSVSGLSHTSQARDLGEPELVTFPGFPNKEFLIAPGSSSGSLGLAAESGSAYVALPGFPFHSFLFLSLAPAQSPSVAETLHPAFTGVQQYAGTCPLSRPSPRLLLCSVLLDNWFVTSR